MKFAFVTQPGHAVVPAAGSIELWETAVARALAEQHEITIYASRPPTLPSSTDGPIGYRFIPHGRASSLVRAIRLVWRLFPAAKPFFASVFHPFEYWLRIARDARQEGYDVLHVFNYSQALPLFSRLTTAKIVLHMHCEWLTQLDRRMIDRRLRHADLIVGCSEHITDLVRSRFPQHAARCATIYNGVDVGPKRDTATRADDAIRLLNVGRVSPEKGLHVLLEALEIVVTAHPKVRLTILGEESPVPYEFAVKVSDDELVRGLARFYGSSYLSYLQARMSPALGERVSFVSRVSHEEALRYYRDADIFVYPSLFESFAIPPVEAMAAGLPVVASRVGGMRETIVHEQTGLFVERDDPTELAAALIRLIEDPGLCRRFGEAGAVRAAMFSWPRIAAEVDARLTELVQQARETTRADSITEFS